MGHHLTGTANTLSVRGTQRSGCGWRRGRDFGSGDFGAASGSGWDFLSIGGAVAINSSLANHSTIDVTSLTVASVAANAANFSPALDQSWIHACASGISGFSADKFAVDSSAFSNLVGPNGSWNVTRVDDNVVLHFTVLSEPSSLAKAIARFGGLLNLLRRRDQDRSMVIAELKADVRGSVARPNRSS